MRNLIVILPLVILSIFGCFPPLTWPENPIKFPVSLPEASRESTPVHQVVPPPRSEPKIREFDIPYANTNLRAAIDDKNEVTILNYPEELQGKIILKHFGSRVTDTTPFSEKHCQKIKGCSGVPLCRDLTRSAYYSMLWFEMPLFLDSGFRPAIFHAIKAAGIGAYFMDIKNPVESVYGELEINFSEDSISRIIGDLDLLSQQLNLASRGPAHDGWQKIIVVSGDLICDLVSGDAQMTMIYPFGDEGKTIKIHFDPVKIEIDS